MSSVHTHLSRRSTRSARPRAGSAIGLRIRVFLRRGRLDTMLAGGAAADQSPELALRASQLTSERNRNALADSLEGVARVAHGTARRRTASPPLASRDVRACSGQLMDLARLLRARPEVGASGVALTQRLLTDGSGPLYIYGQNDALWRAVRDAGAALACGRS
jgi:hypothetical protein